MPNIDEIWDRIVQHEGQSFTQIRGKVFEYSAYGGYIILSTTNQQIPESHFRKALVMVPLRTTTVLKDLRGPSYIYAILMDMRISQGDW